MRASDFARVAEGQTRLVQCPQCGCWFIADAASEGEACRPCYEGWNPPREGGEPWPQPNAGSSPMTPGASS